MTKAILEKREALNYFMRGLLDRARNQTAKVMVFGSLVKKRARAGSDVDIFIVYHGDEEKLLDVVSELSFETALKYGESVEPFLMSIHEFNSRKNQSLILGEILRTCEVIYEMNEKESFLLEAQDYADLAEEFLTYAKGALNRKELRVAIDEGCNAVELAVKALILIRGENLASSHGGIVQQFGRLYVITKELHKEVGKNIRKALTLRSKARYDPGAKITEEDANSVTKLAEELIKALKGKIRGFPFESKKILRV